MLKITVWKQNAAKGISDLLAVAPVFQKFKGICDK